MNLYNWKSLLGAIFLISSAYGWVVLSKYQNTNWDIANGEVQDVIDGNAGQGRTATEVDIINYSYKYNGTEYKNASKIALCPSLGGPSCHYHYVKGLRWKNKIEVYVNREKPSMSILTIDFSYYKKHVIGFMIAGLFFTFLSIRHKHEPTAHSRSIQRLP